MCSPPQASKEGESPCMISGSCKGVMPSSQLELQAREGRSAGSLLLLSHGPRM